MTLTEVRRLLAELDIRPSKALGQNFLIDGNILQIILREADVRRDETVLEIGPGLGMLTQELLDQAKRVIAIEKDSRLADYIRARFPQVELIAGDAVEIVGRETPPGFVPHRETTAGNPVGVPALQLTTPFDKVVANLPYSISTPILQRLVEGEPRPRRIVVTIQREVAQRLAAKPRHKDYGALTLFTQLRYHATVAHVVSPGCFYPSPRVDSAIVVLDRRDPRVKLDTGAPFHEIVRAGFGQRRKMLRKLLVVSGADGKHHGPRLASAATDTARVDAAFVVAGVSSTARAEELSLDQWITLANELR